MIQNLESDLLIELKSAKELYVAVALMKDYGLKIIEDSVPKNCKRNYLVGINLPTTPKVLTNLFLKQKQDSNISSKIFAGRETYHPKVYLIRKDNDELVAFIGSTNATYGGFNRNIEMNFSITNQTDCKKLFDWFNDLYITGKEFDEDYIKEYEENYRRNRALSNTINSNIDNLNGNATSVTSLNVIVPSEQFFTQRHFDSFAPATHFLTDSSTVNSRATVRERFLELHEIIFPQFMTYGMNNLNTHPSKNNYVSQHFHSRGNNHIPKDAIWLQYGKSEVELEVFDTDNAKMFVNNIRIQIILRHTNDAAFIGIWLFVGKNNASYEDRKYLKKNLKDNNFISTLYNYLYDLGGAYSINIGSDELDIMDMTSHEVLTDFLNKDNYSQYFIVGRDYPPDHVDLSADNIVETVLTEFSKLYKIYDLIKAK